MHAHREAIRLASPQAGMGLYTNLGALLMGSGRIDDCLTALQTGIALAHKYKQTDSNLVQLLSTIMQWTHIICEADADLTAKQSNFVML